MHIKVIIFSEKRLQSEHGLPERLNTAPGTVVATECGVLRV